MENRLEGTFGPEKNCAYFFFFYSIYLCWTGKWLTVNTCLRKGSSEALKCQFVLWWWINGLLIILVNGVSQLYLYELTLYFDSTIHHFFAALIVYCCKACSGSYKYIGAFDTCLTVQPVWKHKEGNPSACSEFYRHFHNGLYSQWSPG